MPAPVLVSDPGKTPGRLVDAVLTGCASDCMHVSRIAQLGKDARVVLIGRRIVRDRSPNGWKCFQSSRFQR